MVDKVIKFVVFFLIPVSISCDKKCLDQKAKLQTVEITDHSIRKVIVPKEVNSILCSGSGCLRYICYLQGQEKIVAVDDIETQKSAFNARPYHLANPKFTSMPIFGEFRGYDNPELIVSLKQQPQVIFKTYSSTGYNPQELQKKTGIPVISLEYGDLTHYVDTLFASLRLMGKIINKEKRAEDCISFFKSTIDDLKKRTQSIPDGKKVSCYIGGIAFRGPHGVLSTEPGYAPFTFLSAKNVAFNPTDGKNQKRSMIIAKEKLIEWDPEIMFIDLSTLQLTDKTSAIYQIKNDPVYKNLKAIKNNNIYAVLPYNGYTTNHGSVFANAYYIGKILFPEQFNDIEPQKKADEIFTFLVNSPVFEQLNTMFQNQVFKQLEL